MKRKVFILTVIFVTLSVQIMYGCYNSYKDAWAECNAKYYGKCRYLGSDFQVCKSLNSSQKEISFKEKKDITRMMEDIAAMYDYNPVPFDSSEEMIRSINIL